MPREKLPLDITALPVTQGFEPIKYQNAICLVHLYHASADNLTTEMQREFIDHLKDRAFCKPGDVTSPTSHPLFQSLLVSFDFTWPKWMILSVLYGPHHPDLASVKKIIETRFGQADDLTRGPEFDKSDRDTLWAVFRKSPASTATAVVEGSDAPEPCKTTLDASFIDSISALQKGLGELSLSSADEKAPEVGAVGTSDDTPSQQPPQPETDEAAPKSTPTRVPKAVTTTGVDLPTQKVEDLESTRDPVPSSQWAEELESLTHRFKTLEAKIEELEKDKESKEALNSQSQASDVQENPPTHPRSEDIDDLVRKVIALETTVEQNRLLLDKQTKEIKLANKMVKLLRVEYKEAHEGVERKRVESHNALSAHIGVRAKYEAKVHVNAAASNTKAQIDAISERVDRLSIPDEDLFDRVVRSGDRMTKMNIRIDRLAGRMYRVDGEMEYFPPR